MDDISENDTVVVQSSNVPDGYPLEYTVDSVDPREGQVTASSMKDGRLYKVRGFLSEFAVINTPVRFIPRYKNSTRVINPNDKVTFPNSPTKGKYEIQEIYPALFTATLRSNKEWSNSSLYPVIVVDLDELVYAGDDANKDVVVTEDVLDYAKELSTKAYKE